MPGARSQPAASRAKKNNTRVQSLQVRRINRHSLRDGFTVSFVLFPGTGLSCPRRS